VSVYKDDGNVSAERRCALGTLKFQIGEADNKQRPLSCCLGVGSQLSVVRKLDPVVVRDLAVFFLTTLNF
jgi:hypothetical protein